MQLTVFTKPLKKIYGLMYFSQVPLLSLTVNIFIYHHEIIQPQPINSTCDFFSLLYIMSPFINQFYVLEKFAISNTGQNSVLWKLYLQKRLLVDEDDHQHPLAGSQDFYEMGFCVQVVPSGRASSNSNQWGKKKRRLLSPDCQYQT